MAKTGPDPAVQGFRLIRHQLDNGLRIVLQPDPRVPLTALNLWYHVGSKNEKPGQSGFAHLFEHLLFTGSKHVASADHFRLIQQVGGVANGSTYYDRTNYYETVPAHELDRALWLESDRMGFFLEGIDQKKLDMQREVVINERRQRVDNQPYGRAYEIMYELLFPLGHPYRTPVIGSIADLEAASLDMVRSFFADFYVPNNTVLTVAGDFDPDDVLARVDRFFGEIPAGPAPAQPRPAPVRLEAPQRALVHDRVKLARIYLSYHLPAYGETDWYAADLLATAATSGKSSPFYQELVYHERLAQDVSAYVTGTECAAVMHWVATVSPGVEVERLEQALGAAITRLAATPLPSEQIERACNRLQLSYYAELQTLERRADLISERTTFFDDPGLAFTEVERYRALAADDLMAGAGRYLQPDQQAAVVIVPGAP
jgi:zinc protease